MESWEQLCFPEDGVMEKKKKTTLMRGLNLWQDHGSPLSDLFFFSVGVFESAFA